MTIREQILESRDDALAVFVPEWKCTVYLRPMSGRSREQFEKQVGGGSLDAILAVLVATVVDMMGSPVFTADDIELLKDKNSVVLLRLFQHATKINGISKSDIDELEKN